MRHKKITVPMMADAMGVQAQAIRLGLQCGHLTFGIAMKQTTDQYSYIIYPEKAREIVGDKQMAEWGY